MALEYFLYTTDYNNTLVDRSDTTFSPVPPYAEILIDYFIPEIQPLYLYRESGGTIVHNDDDTINAYLAGTSPPPQPEDPIETQAFTGYTATTQQEFTGYTATTEQEFNSFTGTTLPANYYNKTEINSYSASTKADINTRVFRSGDTMTGTLCTSSNLLASGAVTGSSVSASVLMTTPVLNASTSISAPQITGTTCITSPISCATTRMQAPVVCGGTCVTSPITVGSSCVCSPIVLGSSYICSPVISASTNMFGEKLYAQSCFCSLGTSVLDGGVTAASFLNVSGATVIGNTLSVTSLISEGGIDLETKYLQTVDFDTYSGETDTRLFGIEGAVTGNTEDIVQNANDITYLSGQTDTKLNITDFNSYSATTDSRLDGIDSDIVYLSGQTDTKLNITDFNTFSGTTLPANYYNKTEINSYTGVTDTRLDGIDSDIVYLSGQTDTKLAITDFNTFSGTTLPANYYNKTEINSYSASTLTDINTRVYRSGDTMTGSLNTSGGFYATQSISGTSIYGSVSMLSPIVESITCLCSQGTTQLDGAVTAASTLSVSGATYIGEDSLGANTQYLVVIDETTGKLANSTVTIDSITGGTGYYYYTERNDLVTTTAGPISYISGVSTTLEAGTWSIDFNAIGGNQSVNKTIITGFYIDDVLQGDLLTNKTSSSSNTISMVITKDLTLTAGTHIFEIRFEAPDGVAYMSYGAIRARIVK